MLQKFTEHISLNFPFLKDKKLLIAISGGLDSVVLFHLLHQLNYNISLAHCNFKLRDKESDLDEEFVRNISQKTSNQFFTKRFNTSTFAKKNKISTQIAARALRYNWFQEVLTEYNFDFVLTAHHLDDNLETFLINLTRGSGLEGFTGIPAQNGTIVRPLLPFSRSDILKYAQENKLTWREDASNASTKYTRNKIRHQVIPVLKEINPSILSSFEKTISNLQESQQIIKDRIETISKEVTEEKNNLIKLDIGKIKQLSNPKAYLFELLKAYQFTEWTDVYNLLSAQTGKQVFSKTHRLLKDRDFLILSEIDNKETEENQFAIQENQSEINKPIQLTFKEVNNTSTENKQTIYVDKDLLKYPLQLRKWQNGDYLYPTGMQGKKKLSKFFKDEKFSLLEKENAWLLCNANNEIIWVVNYRQDRRFAPKQNTTHYLKISSL
jgi:tRNA(Ile)-lysidine synthase